MCDRVLKIRVILIEFYCTSVGDSTPGEAQANNENKEERKERQQRRACAAKSTREGIRLWWWLAEGNGADARGPRSVRTGTRAQPQTGRGNDTETATRDGREADAAVGVVDRDSDDG